MIDIAALGKDVTFDDSDIYKGKNIITTQIGDIYYDLSFGIDIDSFLQAPYAIQNESFHTYIRNSLIEYGIDVLNDYILYEDFIDNHNYELNAPVSTQLIL